MNETYKNIEKMSSVKERELKDFLKSIAEHAGYFPELCEIKKEEWFGEIMKILSR